jgi:sirohydrochlorin cobaltochelatase
MIRLVLFAHGSAKPEWRVSVDRLYAKLQARAGEQHVRVAFLTSCEPDLAAVAAEAVQDGVVELRILPLFMSAQGHVLRDLPGICAELRARWPDLEVSELPPVGEHPRVVAAMADIAADCAQG